MLIGIVFSLAVFLSSPQWCVPGSPHAEQCQIDALWACQDVCEEPGTPELCEECLWRELLCCCAPRKCPQPE